MVILVKKEEGGLYLVGEYSLISIIKIPWFFIHIIIIILKILISMYGLILSNIFKRVHDGDNWDSPWMIQSTDGIDRYWHNIMIIDAMNVYTMV